MERNEQLVEQRRLTGKPFYLFGKLDTNDVQCGHPSISRHHVLIYTDTNLDLNLVDLGSKAGTYRQRSKDYEQDERQMKQLAEEEVRAMVDKQKVAMVEKLSVSGLDQKLLRKLTKEEKISLAFGLKGGGLDVEKVNGLARLGSLDVLRQTLESVAIEEMEEKLVAKAREGGLMEAEKLRQWVPVKMSEGAEKLRIGLSQRWYYFIPDYAKVERYLDKKQKDLLIDSKLLSLKFRSGGVADADFEKQLALEVKVLNTLYVGGIDGSMTERDIREQFESYGRVRDVRIPINRRNGLYKGFAFITFDREEDVQAVLKMAGFYIKGKRLTIKIAEEDKNVVIERLDEYQRKLEEEQRQKQMELKKRAYQDTQLEAVKEDQQEDRSDKVVSGKEQKQGDVQIVNNSKEGESGKLSGSLTKKDGDRRKKRETRGLKRVKGDPDGLEHGQFLEDYEKGYGNEKDKKKKKRRKKKKKRKEKKSKRRRRRRTSSEDESSSFSEKEDRKRRKSKKKSKKR